MVKIGGRRVGHRLHREVSDDVACDDDDQQGQQQPGSSRKVPMGHITVNSTRVWF
jgi:hypothetical protein